MSTIFEGSEKKLELILKPGSQSLRTLPEKTWENLVALADARILSKISNGHCDAYLLSESSLFVWDDSLLMITCGSTTLVNAADYLLEMVPQKQVEAFFFERKNEYFPHLQKSSFFSDVKKLENRLPGLAYRLGGVDEHHIYLYHSQGPLVAKNLDCTLEVLMYDLQGGARDVFNQEGCSAEQIRKLTGVDRILSDFTIDDYAFSPSGYSLNAIKDSHYYTIHVTPQAVSPYVSFETNVACSGDVQQALAAVLEVFRPQNFDIVFFDGEGRENLIDVKGYSLRTRTRHEFEGGFKVQFCHFSQGEVIEQPAQLLKI